MFSKSKVERFGNKTVNADNKNVPKSKIPLQKERSTLREKTTSKFSVASTKSVENMKRLKQMWEGNISSRSKTSSLSLCSKDSSQPSKIPKAIKPTSKPQSRNPSFFKNNISTISEDNSVQISQETEGQDNENLVKLIKSLLEQGESPGDLYKTITKIFEDESNEIELNEIDYKFDENKIKPGGDTQDFKGIDEVALQTLMLKIRNIANGFMNICYKTINQKQDIFDKCITDSNSTVKELKQQLSLLKSELKDFEIHVKLQMETEEKNICSYLNELKSILLSAYPDGINSITQNLKLIETEQKLLETEEELTKEKNARKTEADKYKGWEIKVEELNKMKDELREHLEEEKIQNEKHKENENIYEQKLNILKNELRTLKFQKQDSELKLLEYLKSDTVEKENEYKSKIAELTEQLENMDFQLEETYGEKAHVEEKYKLLKQETEKRLKEFQEKYHILEQDLNKAEGNIELLEEELKVRSKEKKKLLENINKYKEQNNAMLCEIENQNSLITKLGIENQKAQENNARYDDSENSQEENVNLTVEDVLRYNELNSEIAHLRAKLDEEMERNEILSNKLLKLQQQYTVNKQLEIEHQNLLAAREKVMEMKEEKKSMINDENLKLESHVNLLRDQIHVLTEKYKKKQYEIMKLQKTLDQKNRVIEMCKKENDMLVEKSKFLGSKGIPFETNSQNVQHNFFPVVPAYVAQNQWPPEYNLDSNPTFGVYRANN